MWCIFFFLILRPVLMSLTAAFNSRAFMPNIWTMTLNRLHGHVLGHSLKYFEDDFAGRLAQKETQSSIALADAVQESIHAVLFGITTVVTDSVRGTSGRRYSVAAFVSSIPTIRWTG